MDDSFSHSKETFLQIDDETSKFYMHIVVTQGSFIGPLIFNHHIFHAANCQIVHFYVTEPFAPVDKLGVWSCEANLVNLLIHISRLSRKNETKKKNDLSLLIVAKKNQISF